MHLLTELKTNFSVKHTVEPQNGAHGLTRNSSVKRRNIKLDRLINRSCNWYEIIRPDIATCCTGFLNPIFQIKINC